MRLIADSGLIKVIPGLMVWTLVAFGLTFWGLKHFAFGPVQKAIDDRRDRIRSGDRTRPRTPATRRASSSRSTAA